MERSLNHTRWECKYHVVFIPKYRRKRIFGQIRQDLGQVLRRLADQRESSIEEGHLHADHVHMLISIPPKYSVAQVIGYMKGKSAIHIARTYGGRKRNFRGQHFWAARLLRFDGGKRRGCDPEVHHRPRTRGPSPGPARLALSCRL